jgi:hypothetical protein
MPIAKIQSEADFYELLRDTDFKYVPLLAESLRRVAAYYEYARESAELIEVVTALRKSRIFETGGENCAINPELMRRIAAGREMYPIEALYILTECDDFPRKPFYDALQNGEVLKRPGKTLGVSGPVELPWKVVLSLRNHLTRQGFSETQFFDLHSRGVSTLHAISIPWNYTDQELADFFRKLIPRLRPPGSLEPKKAGRRGRSCASGAVDMLNQLGAFRLNRAGWKFDRACKITRKITPYISENGWKKAVRAAEERINNMTKRAFFG